MSLKEDIFFLIQKQKEKKKQKMRRLNMALGGVVIDDVVCINLKKRKQRKQKIKREATKKHFPVRFLVATNNEEFPNIGKFESHLRCIEEAKKYKSRNVLILEDDIQVVSSRFHIPPPPKEWDMLFLGGNIQSVMENEDSENAALWKRATNLICHAYIVNQTAYDLILKEGRKILKERKIDNTLDIDHWYCQEIQPKIKSYIVTTEYVIQRDGYSDVKKKNIIYRQQLVRTTNNNNNNNNTATQLATPEYEVVDKKYMRIKLPTISDDDLPPIALITCVHNQADLFQFTQWCYYNIDYPREKLTWIIVDDSAHEDKVSPLIDGKDSSIKYISCKMESDYSFLSFSRKINIAMTYVGGYTKHILHYQLGCYYKPSHVKSRVRIMMSYPEYGCFGCTKYGVYDTTKSDCWEQVAHDENGNQTILYEPSLCYTKDFWLARSFDESQYTMESIFYIRGRQDQVMQIPYNFVLITLTWEGQKLTETSRYGIKGKTAVSNVTGTGTTKIINQKQQQQQTNSLSDKNDKPITQSISDLDFQTEWDTSTKNMIMMLGMVMATESK